MNSMIFKNKITGMHPSHVAVLRVYLENADETPLSASDIAIQTGFSSRQVFKARSWLILAGALIETGRAHRGVPIYVRNMDFIRETLGLI